MAATFEPFQDRLSRDIRNGLSTAFIIEAVASLDPEPVRRTAAQYLEQAVGECYREYIEERLLRYEKALARFRRGPSAVLWQAAVLWDLQLFFEVHELLEEAWLKAAGDEKLVLQALIRAAGVYIKLEYGYRDAALKMAGHALPVLTTHHQMLAPFFDPETLLSALANPALPPPRLLA